MIEKKHIVLILAVILIIGTCLFSTCKSKNVFNVQSHYVDITETRTQQVEKCGSCHKEVYNNWKMGPHANAFSKLESHDLMLDSSKNFPHGYNQYVEDNMEKICASCHTGQNIFETNFMGVDHLMSPHLISKDSLPHVFEQAYTRDLKNREGLLSGVDCITCHVQGDKVVTNFHSQASDTLGLIKSNIFSSNMSCYSCHHHQVITMKELVRDKVIPFEVGCVNCHQEYDEKKKGVHYFYWRNDHDSKKRPAHLNIFECARLFVERTEDGYELRFTWTNTIMPHGFSECGEAKCKVVAVQKNGSKSVLLEQYLNRKNFFDSLEDMPNHFRIGRNGNQFDFNRPILQTVALSSIDNIDCFMIIGEVKPQYWSSEVEFIQIFEKRIPMESFLKE